MKHTHLHCTTVDTYSVPLADLLKTLGMIDRSAEGFVLSKIELDFGRSRVHPEIHAEWLLNESKS